MRYLHFRSCPALILGAIGGCLALAACRPAGTAGIVAATTPTATANMPAHVTIEPYRSTLSWVIGDLPSPSPLSSPQPDLQPASPSASPLSAPDIESLMATVASTPSALPPAPTPTLPPMAARLPADQPWLLVSGGPSQCGQGVQSYRLVAIDGAGGQMELDRGVTAMAERPGAPPLLAVCAADGSAAIVDPLGWTSIPLALERGVVVNQLALSPDQRQAVLQTMCWRDTLCDDGRPSMTNQIVDLHTGALRPADTIPVSSNDGYGSSERVELLGWGTAGVYYRTERNKAGGTTLQVIDPADPLARSNRLAISPDYVLNAAQDIIVFVPSAGSGKITMVLSNLRERAAKIVDRAAWFSTPVFAPDGTALAYVRSDQDVQTAFPPIRWELVLFDIVGNTRTVLNTTLGIPGRVMLWSQDGQRIVVASQSVQGEHQVSLLARDGTLINTVPFRGNWVFCLTPDEQLVFEAPDGQSLEWLPLRAGATPYTAAFPLAYRRAVSVVQPLLGGR